MLHIAITIQGKEIFSSVVEYKHNSIFESVYPSICSAVGYNVIFHVNRPVGVFIHLPICLYVAIHGSKMMIHVIQNTRGSGEQCVIMPAVKRTFSSTYSRGDLLDELRN